jgi:hypothetical protein
MLIELLKEKPAGCQWLMPALLPIILATQEAEIRRKVVQSQPRQTVPANSSTRPYLEKPFTKIGRVEWLKVSSSPSTAKNKNHKGKKSQRYTH